MPCSIDIISLSMQRSHHPSSGRMYICLDGVFVRSNAGKDRFHEGKVGFIYTDERESAGNRLRILNKRYVSSFEDSYVFGGHLRGEALRLAMRAYKEVFIIGDGWLNGDWKGYWWERREKAA